LAFVCVRFVQLDNAPSALAFWLKVR
jgi:hypothetical protein